MKSQVAGALWALLLIAATTGVYGANCDAKYDGQTPTHTMCLDDSSNAVEVVLTQAVKDQIVDRHNEIRREVKEPASDMLKMTWDDRLAQVAVKWAMQCKGGHDSNRAEPELPGFVGQNAGSGHSTFMDVVNAWYNEIDLWNYGYWSKATGHYIQQIFSKAYLIGCGQAQCNGRNQYACNYYWGTISNMPQYKKGSSCSDCPNTCDSSGKLCDCGSAKGCFNGGQLNIDTCVCNCPSLWSGDDCKTKACPKEDFENWCAYSSFSTRKCFEHSYYNKTCPIRCGVCPKPCGDMACQNDGELDPYTCTCNCKNNYSGHLCEICPPQDLKSWCIFLSVPSDCTHSYYKKVCPITCAMCG